MFSSDHVDDMDDDNDGILDVHDADDDGDGIEDVEVTLNLNKHYSTIFQSGP